MNLLYPHFSFSSPDKTLGSLTQEQLAAMFDHNLQINRRNNKDDNNSMSKKFCTTP